MPWTEALYFSGNFLIPNVTDRTEMIRAHLSRVYYQNLWLAVKVFLAP